MDVGTYILSQVMKGLKELGHIEMDGLAASMGVQFCTPDTKIHSRTEFVSWAQKFIIILEMCVWF